MGRSYVEKSKVNWCSAGLTEHETNYQEVQTGALQRIAAATEAMAKNYVQLQNDNEWLKRSRQSYMDRVDSLERSNAALRGVITKLKKRQPGSDTGKK